MGYLCGIGVFALAIIVRGNASRSLDDGCIRGRLLVWPTWSWNTLRRSSFLVCPHFTFLAGRPPKSVKQQHNALIFEAEKDEAIQLYVGVSM
jgi:hypothetical protein